MAALAIAAGGPVTASVLALLVVPLNRSKKPLPVHAM